MISVAIILFREIFEIALILSIIIFAVKNIKNWHKYVGAGIVCGVLSSFLVATIFYYLKEYFQADEQEIFNICILSLAVFLIGYTVLWMDKHSKEFIFRIKETSKQVQAGKKPLYAISIIIASAFIREGMEIVLFINGVLVSNMLSWQQVLNGILIGTFFGVLCGASLYLTLFNIPKKYIFSVTKWLLVAIASAMGSEIATLLSTAGIVNIGSSQLWDSSWLISNESIIGKVLRATIGYHANPTSLQLSFSIIIFLTLFALLKLKSSKNK